MAYPNQFGPMHEPTYGSHGMFLEHWNSQKSVSNIWPRFSCLLDEEIPKLWKKLNSHDGFLRYRGSPPYGHFGTWKKTFYMKFVLGLYWWIHLTLFPPTSAYIVQIRGSRNCVGDFLVSGAPCTIKIALPIQPIFLEFPHQVDMKNVFRSSKHFLWYFNTLETHSAIYRLPFRYIFYT